MDLVDKEMEFIEKGYKYPIVSKKKDIYNWEKYDVDTDGAFEAYVENSKYGEYMINNDEAQDIFYNFIQNFDEVYKINPTLTLLQDSMTPPPYLDHPEEFFVTNYCYNEESGEYDIEDNFRVVAYHPYKTKISSDDSIRNAILDKELQIWENENLNKFDILYTDESWYSPDCFMIIITEKNKIIYDFEDDSEFSF